MRGMASYRCCRICEHRSGELPINLIFCTFLLRTMALETEAENLSC